MAKITPTQRSKKYLENQGYTVAITERWNAFAKIRQDLFGIIDLLAIKPGEVLGVQTTSGSNVSARLQKIKAAPVHKTILASGIKIVVHGWAKRKTGKYELIEREII